VDSLIRGKGELYRVERALLARVASEDHLERSSRIRPLVVGQKVPPSPLSRELCAAGRSLI